MAKTANERERQNNPVQNDSFAEHCGIELLTATDGASTARMKIQPWHLNGIGSVQGGAIFTLADVALAAASNARDDTISVSLVTDIRYFSAVSSGTLTARCKAVSVRRTVATYLVEISNENNEDIASVQGTVFHKPRPATTYP